MSQRTSWPFAKLTSPVTFIVSQRAIRRDSDLSLNPARQNLSFTSACERGLFPEASTFGGFGTNGGRSSMVELQIVVLAVAGSSPVGRPPLLPLKRVSDQKVWQIVGS